MEISRESSIDDVKDKLISMGWILMNSSNDPHFKQVYNKGYTKMGFAEKVYHLHVRYKDDWDELYFRDYLIKHTNTVEEYGKLKLRLWKKFEHNRDGYTAAKTDFVLNVTKKARIKYGNRYG